MSHKRQNEFIDTITKQIRFPFDRKNIAIELKDHLSELEAYYYEKTHDRQEADRLAILEMGDPKAIGKALNQVHRPLWGWLWLISKSLCILLSLSVIWISGQALIGSYQASQDVGTQDLTDQFYLASLGENPNHIQLARSVSSLGSITLDHQTLIFDEIQQYTDGTLVILYRDIKPFGFFGSSPDDIPLAQLSKLILRNGKVLSFRTRLARSAQKQSYPCG